MSRSTRILSLALGDNNSDGNGLINIMHDECRNPQTPTNTPPISPVTLEQAAIANELQQLINYDSESEISHDDSVVDPDYTPEIDVPGNAPASSPISSPLPTSPSLLPTPSDLRSVETINLFGHNSDLIIDRSDIHNISFQMNIESDTSTSATPTARNSPELSTFSALPSAVNSPELSTSSAIPSAVNSPELSTSSTMLSVVDSSSFGDQGSQPTLSSRSRAKRKNEDSWKQNIRKKLRNNGKEYYTCKKELKLARKAVLNNCKCKEQCNTALTQDAKLDIFKSFWNLGNIDRQRDFLIRNVETSDAKSSRSVNSRRKYTLKYTLSHNNKKYTVCKNFFLGVLNITDKMVRTALDKKRRSVAAVASPDKRGKHSPGIKLPDVLVEHANAHIESFPTVPSHWCRKDTKKVYLEPILNQEKMYKLYLEKCQQDNIVKPISKTSYRELLLKKNIAFHKPRKDLCWCHHYEMLPEDQREEKREEYTAHIKRKQEANTEKAADKIKAEQDHSYMSVNFDMEAVLYSPLLLGKPVFYKRKIACINFTVFDTATKQGYCYKWPEYEGNRGANEVATCLYLFLQQVPARVSHIVLHSDCCPGQNRNSILLYMLMTFQSSNDCTLDFIDLKFLEPGHTHMECDNMHAAIERASESARIYIPDDWNNVINLAVKTKPYKLFHLTHDSFIDFKSMKESALPASIKATDGTGLAWNRVKWLRFRKDCPGRFYFKLEWSDDFKEVVRPRTRLSRHESTSMIKAYASQIPLTGAKIKDLLEMCRTGLIPTTYHSFYNSLPHKPSSRVAPESDDEDANLMASRSAYRRRNRRN